jgi:16S rRNA (guanine966-N2)-methyltransferase
MRVSGGELRSREIHVPRGREVRPTPGRVKEALFSILADRIAGARVLDLFAGTGAIGFEALSRGAAHVTFVEAHAQTAARILQTATRLGVASRIAVIAAPAERAVRALEGTFDFVYADPPYAAEPPSSIVAALRARGAIRPGTIVVYEHRSGKTGASFEGTTLRRRARYGDVALEFFDVDA